VRAAAHPEAVAGVPPRRRLRALCVRERGREAAARAARALGAAAEAAGAGEVAGAAGDAAPRRAGRGLREADLAAGRAAGREPRWLASNTFLINGSESLEHDRSTARGHRANVGPTVTGADGSTGQARASPRARGPDKLARGGPKRSSPLREELPPGLRAWQARLLLQACRAPRAARAPPQSWPAAPGGCGRIAAPETEAPDAPRVWYEADERWCKGRAVRPSPGGASGPSSSRSTSSSAISRNMPVSFPASHPG
jgi:hypothetical protein